MITTDVDTIAYADEHLDEQAHEPNGVELDDLFRDDDTTPLIKVDATPTTPCRGLRCHCQSYAQIGIVAGYPTCYCGHAQGTHHRPKKTGTTKVRRS